MSPRLNEAAPDFRLYNTFKKEVTLSENRGHNVVLLFFPLAFTSTCTAELCNIRDNFKIYEQLKATVYGISCDSVFVLNKFREEQNLQFDLLSDFNRDACKAYDCLKKDFILGMHDVPKRSAFVIDSNGILRYSEILENAGEQPSYQNIQNCLQSL